MHALTGGVDPGSLEISSMSLNSEASRVSFLIKSNTFARKWLYFIICFNMIVKHEFSYFKTYICFRTEQLVARILSNTYIWLLLKYKTDELGTHSDPRRKNIKLPITPNSLS